MTMCHAISVGTEGNHRPFFDSSVIVTIGIMCPPTVRLIKNISVIIKHAQFQKNTFLTTNSTLLVYYIIRQNYW